MRFADRDRAACRRCAGSSRAAASNFIQAVTKHGGSWAQGVQRVCRCNPRGGSGFDPPQRRLFVCSAPLGNALPARLLPAPELAVVFIPDRQEPVGSVLRQSLGTSDLKSFRRHHIRPREEDEARRGAIDGPRLAGVRTSCDWDRDTAWYRASC